MKAGTWAAITVAGSLIVAANVPEASAYGLMAGSKVLAVAGIPGFPASTPEPVTGRPGELAGTVRPALVMPRELPRAVAAAEAVRARWNVPVSVTLGQAMHESRPDLSSGLATKGRNYFGVKCSPSPYAAGCIAMDTVDYAPGRGLYTNRGAGFRSYRSPEASFLDYGRVLSLPRYRAAHSCGGDPACFLRAVEAGGYASPGYSGRVLAVIAQNNLRRFDR